MSFIGTFTLVLNAHLPYFKSGSTIPHSDRIVYESISETYVPLFKMLYQLRHDNVPFRLGLILSPTLIAQLADEEVMQKTALYLQDKRDSAKRDSMLFRSSSVSDGDESHDLVGLAEWYTDHYEHLLQTFTKHFQKDLISIIRDLVHSGHIELIASALTYAYLPKLNYDASIQTQVMGAVQYFERVFGFKPQGFWLPECGYRGTEILGDSTRASLIQFLKEANIRYFFAETHSIIGGDPIGISQGNILGRSGDILHRYGVHVPQIHPADDSYSTYEAYEVLDGDDPSGIHVIGRNGETGDQVWGAEWGYPRDFDYRDFRRKATSSGLRYWAVSGVEVDSKERRVYRPDWASFKIDQHGEHFVHMVGDMLRRHHRETNQHGVVCAIYNADFFGQRWFEGISWLNAILRHFSQGVDVEFATPSHYIQEHAGARQIQLRESSWGIGGHHFTWWNGDTRWIWQAIHECETHLSQLASQYGEHISPAEIDALNHATQCLMLMQSADWQFMLTSGHGTLFASQQFGQYHSQFLQIMHALTNNDVESLQFQEKLWIDVDYRRFIT